MSALFDGLYFYALNSLIFRKSGKKGENGNWKALRFTGERKKTKRIIGDLSKKRPTIKFDFAYSKISIVFLDMKLYKNQNGMLCTTIYRKSIDWSNFLSCASAHQKSLKGSITFSQVLRIKRICSEISEVVRYF